MPSVDGPEADYLRMLQLPDPMDSCPRAAQAEHRQAVESSQLRYALVTRALLHALAVQQTTAAAVVAATARHPQAR